MEREDAEQRARQHLATREPPHPLYRYQMKPGNHTADGWYFDYSLEPIRQLQAGEEQEFAGAPGFIVTDNEIRDVSWTEWRSLRASFKE